MILKKNDRELWGIPYQGSKTKLIEKIARFFPNATNFYDLFGGGFSVTHYMSVMRKNSYQYFHYNELRFGMCELIQDSIVGKYNYDIFKPEWITRGRFFAEKESNAHIKIIWSFGNNGKTYLFGKDIENKKKSMHMAVVFDEFDELMKMSFNLTKWPNNLTITGKRLYLKKLAHQKIELVQLQQLERLERLQQLEQLKSFKKINFTNKSYKNVMIHDNSIIYCDIPYFGTADYENSFNHKEFFDWASEQVNPVFISEYEIKDERLTLIKEFNHRSSFSQKVNNEVKERLYGNKAAIKRLVELGWKKTKN